MLLVSFPAGFPQAGPKLEQFFAQSFVNVTALKNKGQGAPR